MNILVTGGSSGIGETAARRLVEAGHNVALFARRAERLVAIADDLNHGQDAVHAVATPGDIGDGKDCVRAVDAAIKAFGGLDGLVNAAGYWVDGPLDAAKVEDIERFIRTDVTGATLITRCVLPALKERGGGRIIHINGLQGFIRQRPPALYAMVESAVRGLCESLRWEAAPHGVHVGLISLGAVANTEAAYPDSAVLTSGGHRTKLSRSEVASAILFMLTRPSGVNVDELILTPLEQPL